MNDSREEVEVQLEAQLHSLLLGRPYGAPTPLDACLCAVRGTTTFCLNIDCVILSLGCLSAAQDALGIAVRKALEAVDVDALNAAVAGTPDTKGSEVGIQADEFRAQVAKLPAVVSTCQVRRPSHTTPVFHSLPAHNPRATNRTTERHAAP